MRKTTLIFLSAILIILGFVGYHLYNDGSSSTIAGAIDKIRKTGWVDQIIKEVPVSGGVFVFYLHHYNNGENVSAEYVKKTLNGWKEI